MIDADNIPVTEELLLHPELIALTTLETALEMAALALCLSYPEITDCEHTRRSDPELCGIRALLRSIRDLQHTARDYHQLIAGELAPDNPPEDNAESFEIDDIPF